MEQANQCQTKWLPNGCRISFKLAWRFSCFKIRNRSRTCVLNFRCERNIKSIQVNPVKESTWYWGQGMVRRILRQVKLHESNEEKIVGAFGQKRWDLLDATQGLYKIVFFALHLLYLWSKGSLEKVWSDFSDLDWAEFFWKVW